MQEGHGVWDCCARCGGFVKFDGVADDDNVYHRNCVNNCIGHRKNYPDKQEGDVVTVEVAAPGIGSITYEIVRIDENWVYGLVIKDQSRILEPHEVS